MDHYRVGHWQTLQNAVSDARGAVEAFGRLGFEAKTTLLDSAATRSALFQLTEDLNTLSPHDSLVVFFAGHGYTVEHTVYKGLHGIQEKVGYLIPVDGDRTQLETCVRLDYWLSALTKLPPRHILVILDCCKSGIALSPPLLARGETVRVEARTRGPEIARVMEPLRTRQSRRVITSALNDQAALDDGPLQGHSLFTGCLISALSGELFAQLGRGMVSSLELFNYIRQEVGKCSYAQQTPDFGAMERDERGELIFEQRAGASTAEVAPVPGAVGSEGRPVTLAEFVTPTTRVPLVAIDAPPELGPSDHVLPNPTPKPPPLPPLPPRAALDPAFAALLDRHHAERRRGRAVVSIISADPMAATTSWAAWAASHGQLTALTDATSLDAAIEDLLTAVPWLRLLQAARAQIARAAKLELPALDAALRDRPIEDRASWLEDAAGDDRVAKIAGWLLSWSTEAWANLLDPETAPVQGTDLLSIVGTLAAPIAVLFHHGEPDETWLERALRSATELAQYIPTQPVAVSAPRDLLKRVAAGADTAKLRHSIVPLARAPRFASGTAGQLAEYACAALARDPRTAQCFERGALVPVHDRERPITVDLFARDTQLVIEIDDWYRSGDLHRYRDARGNDAQLQLAGFYVLRFAADEIERRPEAFVDQVALALASRRASDPSLENLHARHTD